jgi:hypothetical protein
MTQTTPQKQRRARERREKRRAKVEATAVRCKPVCVECGKLATELVGWTAIYRPRPERPDLMAKQFWRCGCGAYVGCHPFTTIPLGRPAGPETQKLRSAAHGVFDRLWLLKAEREEISKGEARTKGYAWLAAQLGIEPRECHIGWMDAATASRVVEICAPAKRKEAA